MCKASKKILSQELDRSIANAPILADVDVVAGVMLERGLYENDATWSAQVTFEKLKAFLLGHASDGTWVAH